MGFHAQLLSPGWLLVLRRFTQDLGVLWPPLWASMCSCPVFWRRCFLISHYPCVVHFFHFLSHRALERRVVLCMFCKGLSLLQPLIFCTVVSCESVLTAVNCKQKFSDESWEINRANDLDGQLSLGTTTEAGSCSEVCRMKRVVSEAVDYGR